MTRRESDGVNPGTGASLGRGTGSDAPPPPPLPSPAILFPPADTAPALLPDQQHRNHAATGASAASVRALTTQLVAFYFRAPVKAFFRTRVDYLAYARALHEQQQQLRLQHTPSSFSATIPSSSRLGAFWQWLRTSARGSAPGVLATAVRHYGWRVVPDQVLPPLVANVGVGAVLYTSYLQIVARLHQSHLERSGSSEATTRSMTNSSRPWPPPGPAETFAAGFLAGSVQSVVAAPLDAVQARYDLGAAAAGMTGSGNPASSLSTAGAGVVATERPQSMWAFSYAKLREIGVRGIFAGWGLSFLKDSLGSAVFFSVFELVKAQAYYGFVGWYYGSLSDSAVARLATTIPTSASSSQWREASSVPTVRPHYAMEPTFLLLAGMGASTAQQVVLHPLSHIQVEHWERLEMLDAKARKLRREAAAVRAGSSSVSASASTYPDASSSSQPPRWRFRMFRAYYRAYQETWAACRAEAAAAGLSMRRWLYRGFWWNTVRQVPSTSAGLIIFELVRRKYGMGDDDVRINRGEYDILLG